MISLREDTSQPGNPFPGGTVRLSRCADGSLRSMKRRLSTFLLWLLIALLPLNAAATRLTCCWPSGAAGTEECEQHRAARQQADAATTKHGAPAGERCAHCSLCCAPTPALQQAAIVIPFVATLAHTVARAEPRYTSRTPDRLDRPPKSFLS